MTQINKEALIQKLRHLDMFNANIPDWVMTVINTTSEDIIRCEKCEEFENGYCKRHRIIRLSTDFCSDGVIK